MATLERDDLPILAGEESNISTISSDPRNARKGPQLLAAFVACLSPLSMGFVLGYSSPTLDELKSGGFLTPNEATWFGSLVTIGAIAGGPLAAGCVEKLGRKTTMMVTCLPFVAGWFCIIFAKHFLLLYFGRVLTGLAMGASSLTAPLYIAEVTTKQLRGLLGAAFQLFVVIGIEMAYVLGIPLTFRWLAVAAACVPALQIIALAFMPETPRWLVSKGDRGRAMTALRWLRGPEFAVEEECSEIETNVESLQGQRMTVGELFQPGVYHPLLVSLGLMVFQQFSGINAVIFYSKGIFSSAGYGDNPDLAANIVGGVMVVATFVSCCLMDSAGRRILLLVSGAFMTLSSMAFGAYYYLVDVKLSTSLSWLSLASLIIYVTSFSLGWGPIPWLVMSEIFPVKAKGLASGIATMVNWTCAFLVTKEFHDLQDLMTEYGVFWLFGGICFCSMIFVGFFVPETKGRSLEEIERIFGRTTSS